MGQGRRGFRTGRVVSLKVVATRRLSRGASGVNSRDSPKTRSPQAAGMGSPGEYLSFARIGARVFPMSPPERASAFRRAIRLRAIALLGGLLVAASPASATTVQPPDFPQLVSRAASVFRGEVVSLRSELVTRGPDRAIFTRVTFRVTEVIRGAPLPSEVTLEFLGGTVGDLTLEVAGMPRFEPGGREIVFVERSGPQICPLVAMAHGRYRVLLDSVGAEFVARDNGAPLVRPDDVALPLTAPAVAVLTSRQSLAAARPLSPAEFTAAVRSEALRARLP